MSSQHKVLKLIRKVQNRVCADCQAVLIPHECYCSQQQLVWLCKGCAMVHNHFDASQSLVLALVDPAFWIPGCLESIALTSNEARNRTLERFVPPGWTKPSASAGPEAREVWIKAKYLGKLFHWPISAVQPPPHHHHQPHPQPQQQPSFLQPPESLPTRLVDFFVVVGPTPQQQQQQQHQQPTPGAAPWSASCEAHGHIPCGIHFSCPESQPDTMLPAIIGDFIFPLGMRLSSEELPPQIVTFVLTDVSRVKIYGTALVFSELLDPEDLSGLLGQPSALPPWPIVYAPKALVLLGHYPFFGAFSTALRELYHASLSASPVPLERYVCNFTLETPLPPLGRTEVVVTLAHKGLVLSRPPQNRLPGVDISYRPLFACLSLDCILTVFKVLCAEFSVIFASDNISLLCPVQEAILSFLFPLTWQGCYIPVLPASMLELFEAPVPFCVGVQKACLPSDPAQHPLHVLVVDLDLGTLSVAGRAVPPSHCNTSTDALDAAALDVVLADIADDSAELWALLNEAMPRQVTKLREKLATYGAQRPGPTALSQVALAYPGNEHMHPIVNFALDGGHAVSLSSTGRKRGDAGGACSCSYSYDSSGGGGGGSSGGGGGGLSLLDPANNCLHGDGFDAREVRAAFLRFFVSLFSERDDRDGRNRQRHSVLAPPSERTSLSRFSTSLFQRISSASPSPASSSFRSTDDAASTFSTSMSMAMGLGKGSPVGNGGSTLGSLGSPSSASSPLLERVLQTQMYSSFADERQFHPDSPEIRFFSESCLEKRNRSKMALTKASTPFLSDTSEAVAERYTAPPPSTAGLSASVFEYPSGRFPALSHALLGQPRPPRVLLRVPDKPRAVALDGSSSSSSKSSRGSFGSSGSSSGSIPSDLYLTPRTPLTPSSYLAILAPMLGSGPQDYTGTGLAFPAPLSTLEAAVRSGAERHARLSAALTAVQARARGRRQCRRFAALLSAVVSVQTLFRGARGRKERVKRLVLQSMAAHGKKVAKVQRFVRFAVCRMRYLKHRHAVVCLQSHFRRRRAGAAVCARRAAQQLVGAWCLGRVVRRRTRALLAERLRRYGRQVVVLWAVAGTPLWHRSSFWLGFLGSLEEAGGVGGGVEVPTFLGLAVVAREMRCLHAALGLCAPQPSSPYLPLDALDVLYSAGQASALLSSARPATPTQTGSMDATLPSAVAAAVLRARSALALERRGIYARLGSCLSEAQRSALYAQAGLAGSQKRKKRLSEALWGGADGDAGGGRSARVVAAVNEAGCRELARLEAAGPEKPSSFIRGQSTRDASALLGLGLTAESPGEFSKRLVRDRCDAAARATVQSLLVRRRKPTPSFL